MKYIAIAVLGALLGFALFMFVSKSLAFDISSYKKQDPQIKIFDKYGLLLYQAGLEQNPDDSYKRAPAATDLMITTINKDLKRKAIKKGLKVYSTLDLPLQNYIQELVLETQSEDTNPEISEVSVLVVNPKDQSILAYIGSFNYYEKRKLFELDSNGLKPFSRITDSQDKTILAHSPSDISRVEIHVWVSENGKLAENKEIASEFSVNIEDYLKNRSEIN